MWRKIRTTYSLLILIILLALFLRVYKIESTPPSLMWDEASVGYNAWTISHYLKDEWGNTLPLAFKSFEEYKMPVHIYITSVFVLIMGLSELSTRLPSALFGVGNIILLFYLVRLIYKNNILALIASFLFAISAFNIHFSRFNHEANFALFFLILGLILFIKSFEKGRWMTVTAFISFSLSLVSYNAAKLVIPLLIFLLLAIYGKEIIARWRTFILPIIIFSVCLLVTYLHPGLSGRNRAAQVPMVGLETAFENYRQYYSWEYLFEKGDKNPRLSTQSGGLFYPVESVFLLIGTTFLLISKQRFSYFVILWAVLSPIPGSLFGGSGEVPHTGRAMFMMGSWTIVSAYGFYKIVDLLRGKNLRLAGVVVGVVIIIYFTFVNLRGYFQDFSKNYSIDWQYGMKQIAEHVKKNPEYEKVFISDARSQPYIFLLYYLKTPLPEFLEDMEYNTKQDRSSNLVSRYGKYNFGNWDSVESHPSPGVLYVLTPSQYDGLRHRALFQIKELISYPNGTDAFYLVSLY